MTTLLDPARDRNLDPYSANRAFPGVTRITAPATPTALPDASIRE
jgi:hypothetical protein